jgi:hypothetical protein
MCKISIIAQYEFFEDGVVPEHQNAVLVVVV